MPIFIGLTFFRRSLGRCSFSPRWVLEPPDIEPRPPSRPGCQANQNRRGLGGPFLLPAPAPLLLVRSLLTGLAGGKARRRCHFRTTGQVTRSTRDRPQSGRRRPLWKDSTAGSVGLSHPHLGAGRHRNVSQHQTKYFNYASIKSNEKKT